MPNRSFDPKSFMITNVSDILDRSGHEDLCNLRAPDGALKTSVWEVKSKWHINNFSKLFASYALLSEGMRMRRTYPSYPALGPVPVKLEPGRVGSF